jgi:DNA-binding MurR/RpiR family transcriptional regulator
MELRIGVVHSPKELSVEVEGSTDDIVKIVDDAMAGNAPIIWVTDVKGRKIGLPADKVAYVEIDDSGASRHVGFGR